MIKYMTVKEMAEYTGLSETTIKRKINNKDIDWDSGEKKGKRLIFRVNTGQLDTLKKMPVAKAKAILKKHKHPKSPNQDVTDTIWKLRNIDQENIKQVLRNNNCVIVILQSGHKGIAECKKDVFDIHFGFLLAYSRALVNEKNSGVTISITAMC